MKVPPPEVIQARWDAYRELVDLGVEMLLANRRRTHPDEDPYKFLQEVIDRAADDRSRANIRILEQS